MTLDLDAMTRVLQVVLLGLLILVALIYLRESRRIDARGDRTEARDVRAEAQADRQEARDVRSDERERKP